MAPPTFRVAVYVVESYQRRRTVNCRLFSYLMIDLGIWEAIEAIFQNFSHNWDSIFPYLMMMMIVKYVARIWVDCLLVDKGFVSDATPVEAVGRPALYILWLYTMKWWCNIKYVPVGGSSAVW